MEFDRSFVVQQMAPIEWRSTVDFDGRFGVVGVNSGSVNHLLIVLT